MSTTTCDRVSKAVRHYPTSGTLSSRTTNPSIPNSQINSSQTYWECCPKTGDDGLNRIVGSHDSPIATRAVSGEGIARHYTCSPAPYRRLCRFGRIETTPRSIVVAHSHPKRRTDETSTLAFENTAWAQSATAWHCMAGVIPYAATFLIFSDYLRPAIRVGALSHAPCVWIFTHDSVGLGEDGPTHQPISQLMGLRMIPNLTVIRPADADETFEAWRIAVENRQGPTALILTRQNLPQLSAIGAQSFTRGYVQRGAYVIADTDTDPEVIIIGTGSETQLALGAALKLQEEGIAARAVSIAIMGVVCHAG